MADTSALFADGAAYERLMGRWSQVVAPIFLDWLNVQSGLRWLDVGCGNGAFTETLVAHCAPATVTAIDPSEGQLAFARIRPGAKMAQFRVGDAQALPFADGSFDAAVMALVISFLPDPSKAVAEMKRVVRPGGWVATYMWDIEGGGIPLRPVEVALASMGVASPVRPSSASSRREAMQEIWEKAGLRSVETRVIRIPVTYPDFDDFWNSVNVPVGPQGKVLQEMSPSAKEQLRTLLRQQLPTEANGRIAYEAFANAVKGRAPE